MERSVLRRVCGAVPVVALLCSVYLPAVAQQVYNAPEYITSTPDSARYPLVTSDKSTWPTKDFYVNYYSDVPNLGDFQVGPTRFTESLPPGSSHTETIQVTNRGGKDATFDISMQDFAPGDMNNPIVLYSQSEGPFTARTWLKPDVMHLKLHHGERAFIPVHLTIPKDASAGDHYASVVVTRETDPNDTKSSGFVAVSQVATLFLITVQGDIISDGTLDYFRSVSPFYGTLPARFTLGFTNKGTVHLVPTGTIQIRNIFGILVDELPMQDWYILRASSREREVDWQPQFALGYYTAQTNLTVDSKTPIQQLSVGFWVIPILPVCIALLAIFVVSFLVQFFMNRFEIRRKK